MSNLSHKEFSARGGSKRSAAKTKAAQENGRRGGRPVTRWPASRPGSEIPSEPQAVLAYTSIGWAIAVGGPSGRWSHRVNKWWPLPDVTE